MDYEKEYKKLKADIKKAHLFAQTDSTKAVLEHILPELAESESGDERIRKEIIAILQYKYKKISKDPKYCNAPQWIAWLEKQKQKGEFDIIDFNCLNTCKKAIEAYRKIEEDKYGVVFPSYDQALIWLDSLEIRIQPKPTWSKEDKRMMDLIISVFEVNHPKSIFKDGLRAVYTDDIVSWLKSIEDRMKGG